MTPRERKLFWAVLLSVGLNLFLLGFLVARHRGGPGPRGPAGPGMFHTGELFDLGASKEMRELLRSKESELRPQRRALRDARRDVKAALEAEPYDAARLGQALSNLQQATQAVQKSMHGALLQLGGELTKEQRRALTKRNFEERPPRERRPPGPPR